VAASLTGQAPRTKPPRRPRRAFTRSPRWARQRAPAPSRPPRDWVAIIVTALPGVAALIAVGFTFASVKATQGQVQIAHQQQITAEQGQITDRYNAAITNLGSHSIEIRLGGIYALQRLMQDSRRDQPTVIAVLCAFVRDQAATPIKLPTLEAKVNYRQPTDIQAALTVVGTGDTARDGRTTVVDFDHAQLDGAALGDLDLSSANLGGANLTGADLTRANLTGANLFDADLAETSFGGANLRGANLFGANLTLTSLGGADLTNADLIGANLIDAVGIDANLNGVDLTSANLTRAALDYANLTSANLTHANLTHADLTHADLTSADLTGADLTGALWPADQPVPKGWLRDPHSGRLRRAP
jgi:hypothetical protein